MKSGIYKITNKVNGKFYIGMSYDMEKRWMKHKSPSAWRNKKTALAKAFRKYGVDNFSFSVLECCPTNLLCEKEKLYISKLEPHYNSTAGGEGVAGLTFSEATRSALSAAGKRQWSAMSSDEKARRIEKNLVGPRVGHPVLPGTREKLRAAAKAQHKKNGPSRKQQAAASNTLKALHADGKLTAHKLKPVLMIDALSGEALAVFDSVRSAAAFIGCHSSGITKACKGGRVKSCGGYKWRYASKGCVETIPKGSRVEMRTTRSAEQPHSAVDEIVQASEMVNPGELDKGLIDLARRSGQVSNIYARVVYENEPFSVSYGLKPDLQHTPMPPAKRGKEKVGVYAVAVLTDGNVNFEFLYAEEVEAIRKQSRASKDGPWQTHEEEMWKKTAIRRLAKTLPLSPEFARAAAVDEQEEIGVIKHGAPMDLGDVQVVSKASTVKAIEEKPEPQQTNQGLEPTPQERLHAKIIIVTNGDMFEAEALCEKITGSTDLEGLLALTDEQAEAELAALGG